MATTHLFQSGNSKAIRIPRALAEGFEGELIIERVGDELHIRKARRSLAGVMEKFAAFSPDFMSAGREQDEQQDREAL